jgi:agmatine deiminase
MPAEWEPHEGTWIAWPHEKTDWPSKFQPVPWIYCEIVRILAQSERVHILVNDIATERKVRRMLTRAHVDMAAVDFFRCPTNRSWTRDYCPIFVLNDQGRPIITNWRFNGWAKYPNWETDDAVPSAIAALLQMEEVQPVVAGHRVVLEGGGIDVNGSGSLVTTEECLLSPIQARNPELTREQMEQAFATYLGVTNVLWLRNGISGDDTHGHVDDLARFVAADTVVIAVEEDPGDPNYAPTQENLQLLREMKTETGAPLRVVPLPMPRPVLYDRQRLPASYANFYIANRAVLVPVFHDSRDREALNTLADLFPDREVIGIASADLVLGLGTLHCMTQQQIAAQPRVE